MTGSIVQLPTAVGYIVAVAVSLALAWLRTVAEDWLGSGNLFLQSYPAIVIAALLGGTGPGIAATLVSAATIGAGYMRPFGEFALSGRVAPFVMFVVVGLFISSVTGALRRSQRAAIASEQRYRSVVDLSPVAVLINFGGRLVFANQSMLTLLGAPSEAALRARTPQSLLHGDSRTLGEARIGDLLSGRVGRVPWVEQEWVREDGTIVPVEVAAALVPWEDGTAVQVLARDLTRDRELRAQQQALLEAAESANRVKDEFLATLSHELRTPLNAVLGWTQMLLQARDPAQLRRGLEVIRRNAQALQVLVEEILQLSRVITGQLRLDPAPLDLRDIVKGALETIAPTAAAKRVRLQAHVPEGPVVVSGDQRRLQQVLWNLVSNAMKFTGPGGEVHVSLRGEEGRAVVAVRDTGQGIAPEFLPHVFDAFRQEDSSSTRVTAGLGLGLALVRRLVEAHGGRVTAESPGPGRGATFTVVLPRAVVAPDAASAAEEGRGILI